MKKMTIVVVKPDMEPEVAEIDNSLAAMQAVVGGHIETVYLPEIGKLILVCNEEGKNKGLPYNRPLVGGDFIAGDFFITTAKGGDFISLNAKQIATAKKLYEVVNDIRWRR